MSHNDVDAGPGSPAGGRRPGVLNRELNLSPLLGQMAIILLISTAASIGANRLRERPVVWFPDDKPLNRSIVKPPVQPGNTSSSTTTAVAEGEIAIDVVLKHLAEGTARFVDAREPHEYDAGHLAGSIHLPSSAAYANMDRVTSQVSPDELIIVYCTGGECEASHTVQKALAEYGFNNVVIYVKGWDEITSSGRFGDYIEQGAGQ